MVLDLHLCLWPQTSHSVFSEVSHFSQCLLSLCVGVSPYDWCSILSHRGSSFYCCIPAPTGIIIHKCQCIIVQVNVHFFLLYFTYNRSHIFVDRVISNWFSVAQTTSIFYLLWYNVKRNVIKHTPFKIDTNGSIKVSRQVAPCLQIVQQDYYSGITSKRLAAAKNTIINFKSVCPLVILNRSTAPFISWSFLCCLQR